MADTRAAMLRLSALVGDRSLFENDAYRKLWLGRVLSHTPVNAVVYAMLIMVVQATGLNFFSSLFVVAYIAPTAIFGAFAGVFVDRLPKGVVLAITNAARAGLCLLLAISTENVGIIYVIAVLLAVGSQFSGPAEGAALPAVVEQEDLTAANSLNNLGSLISQVVGLMVLPALFFNTVGPGPLALVCAGFFALAAFQFLLIRGLGGPVSYVQMSVAEARERFAEAWEQLTQDAVSYVSVVIAVLASTTGLVVVTLLPRYAPEVLGVGEQNIIFLAVPAAFAIWLALRFVRNISTRVSPWWSIGGSFAAMNAGIFLLAFAAPMGDAVAAVNPLGLFEPGPFGEGTARIMVASLIGGGLAFAYTFVNVVTRSIVNERMPREMQGRVFAAQIVLTNLASIPPILLTGIMADIIGVPPVFFLIAVGSGLAALYYAARNAARPRRMAY